MTRLMRFGFVGIANTLLGYCLILSALQLGFNDYVANAIGYLAGMVMGYFLNKRFVFRDNISIENGSFFRYALAVIFSYSVNLFVVSVGISYGMSGSPLLHLVAMICYSGSLYILSSVFVFKDYSSSKLQNIDVVFVVGLLTLPALFLFHAIPVSHDIYWQYWIARQMNHGTELYTQINEVNPPLWFWMALPVQSFADYANISAIQLNNVLHILLTSLVAIISAYLLPKEIKLGEGIKLNRAVFATMVIICAYCVSIQNFAQREHFSMLVTLPYVLLIYRRVMNMPTNYWFALGIGLLAAFGFAMKHYLVVVPVLLELYLLYKRRNLLGVFRPETFAVGLCAVGYIGAILWFAPDFLNLQVPMVFAFYGDFHKNLNLPIRTLLSNRQPQVWSWLLVLFLFMRWNPFKKNQNLLQVLFLTASGFLVAYILQGKGFNYHALPISFFIFLLLSVFLYAQKFKPTELKQYVVMSVVLCVVVGIQLMQGTYKNGYRYFYETAVKQTPKGSTVYTLVLNPTRTWPMVEQLGYRWPSRYFSFWTFNGMALKENDSAENQQLSNEIKHQMVEDLQCNPPEVFLVAQKTKINSYEEYQHLNILEYFLRYKPAAELFKNYTFSHETVIDQKPEFNFDVYTLNEKHAIKSSDPASCRTIF